MNRKRRHLGKIKEELFPIGFGGGAISGEGGGYGFGEISEQDAIHLLHFVKDQGVNVFDVAPIYGFGTSEERIGKAFKNCRDQIFIVDKGGITWDINKRVDIDNSPKNIEEMLKKSLKNLKTDFIDLYLIHKPDPRVDIRFPLEKLERAKERGEIRYLGICNAQREDVAKSLEISQHLTIQNEFNLFNSDTIDSVLDFFREERVGLMGWGCLDKGILSGSVRDENRRYHPYDARSWAPWWKREKRNRENKFRAQKRIQEMIDCFQKEGSLAEGISMLDIAIQYPLTFEQLGVSLIGGKSQQQWEGILNGYHKEIDEELLKQIKKEVDIIIKERKKEKIKENSVESKD